MKKPIPPNLVDLLFCFVQLLVLSFLDVPVAKQTRVRPRLVSGFVSSPAFASIQRSPLVEMPGTIFRPEPDNPPVVASVKHAGFPFPTVGIAALHEAPNPSITRWKSTPVVGARIGIV